MVEKASIDEAFIACCPPDGTDERTAFAAGKALAQRVKAAGAPFVQSVQGRDPPGGRCCSDIPSAACIATGCFPHNNSLTLSPGTMLT